MKGKRIAALLAVAALGLTLLAGCAGGGKSNNAAGNNEGAAGPKSGTTADPGTASNAAELPDKPAGTFTFFINPGATWDPAIWDWGGHHDKIGIFEGLVHYSQGKIVPGVATSWKEEGNVWTFYLRKDAKFSNGNPVTAEAFVLSMQRAVDPETIRGTGKSSSFHGETHIKNYLDIKNGVKKPEELGVRAIDPYTLEIELEEPDKSLLDKLAIAHWQLPVDPQVVKLGVSDDSWTDPAKIVSNGPYMIDKLNVKTDMWLKPNPYYHSKVSLESIHMIWSAPEIKQLLVYQNNESDMATLAPEDVPAVKNDPKLSQELNWFDTAISYTFQVRHSENPALQDERVRQALAMAIDKEAISEKVLGGTGTPSYDGTIAPWMAEWIKDAALPFDVNKAKQLLAEAGYPDGKGFPPLVMLVPGSDDKVAQAVQQMWKQNLGIDVQYQGEEWGTYVTKFNELSEPGTVSVVQNGVGPSIADWKSTIVQTDPLKNELAKIALDGKTWEGYLKIWNDSSLDQGTKNKMASEYFEQHFSKEIMDRFAKAEEAYKNDDEEGMKEFVTWRIQSSWTFPIYQVRNGILLKPNVKGYFPMRMWLSTPPDWLNDITVTK
jgi:oligopeptide transport system substrate-binding protein